MTKLVLYMHVMCGKNHHHVVDAMTMHWYAAGRSGVALRTLVYHEVMVGYLDYIKRQGFTSMFIWACPPLQVHLDCWNCCISSVIWSVKFCGFVHVYAFAS